MKLSEKIKLIKNDFLYKTLFASTLSLAVTLAFAVYNTYLGLSFGDAFAIGISIYYLLLVGIKSSTILVEAKIAKKEEKLKTSIRVKNYKISSVFIFITDLCLIAPIILMALHPKEVAFGIIPAITMAAYSVYKIVISIINYKKSKKSQNPTIVLLKEINIIDSIVSVLTLQHTLIMVNGGMNESMQTLSLTTSIAFICLIVIFSVSSYFVNKRIFKTNLK